MMGHPTCPPPLQQSPSRTLSHSVFMALPVGEISQRAPISSWIIFCVFFFPRQWGNDGVVDAGRNGLCAGLVRSLVIRYCRSLWVAPGLRVISAPSRWSRFNNRWQFRWFGVRWQRQWLTKVRCQVRPQLSVKEVASKVWRITSPSSLSALSIVSTIMFVIMLLPWHHGHVCVIYDIYVFLVLSTSFKEVPCCQLSIDTNNHQYQSQYHALS